MYVRMYVCIYVHLGSYTSIYEDLGSRTLRVCGKGSPLPAEPRLEKQDIDHQSVGVLGACAERGLGEEPETSSSSSSSSSISSCSYIPPD